MRLEQHLVAAPIAAGGLYAITGSWPAALTCLGSGVLIDLDHLLDYLLEHHKQFTLHHFFETWRLENIRYAFLILHSWELLLGLALIGWRNQWPGWLIGILVGLGHHIVLDQWTYRPHPLAYWFLWRWYNRFSLRGAFHPDRECPR